MPKWPNQPWIYEINTWTWLSELSSRYGRKITLANVPAEIWDELARTPVDAVWLMGVWRRSHVARNISLADLNVQAECRQVFGEFSPEHVSGSPYAIAEYSVASELGGSDGLSEARHQLAARGLCLLLDFVPNHVAPDHAWTTEHPEYFVHGDRREYEHHPDAFFSIAAKIIARGQDPYFPPWPDTAQLNAFSPGLRSAAFETLKLIASQCDGVRCDMAMLMLNHIFAQTWGERVGVPPVTDYWRDLIPQVHQFYPDFLFIAEAYWELEWELMQQGFDYCYDKRLYDRLVQGTPQEIRAHLTASLDYQRRLIRFLENHDEPRAAAVFSPPQNRVAAVALMTLPGAKLLHHGQMSGAQKKMSVHLGQCTTESPDLELRSFYEKLLNLARGLELDKGEWQLCEQRGWPDNDGFQNLVSWCWRAGHAKYLHVLNFSDWRSQARIKLPWSDLANKDWNLHDPLLNVDFGRRSGMEIIDLGIYVDLEGHSFHFLELLPNEC